MAVSAFALSVAGCTDGTGPGADKLVDLVLDFCSDGTPTFFAHANQGGTWTRVMPDAAGAVSFQATEKVAIAISFQSLGSVSTFVYYTTAEELKPLSGFACAETIGSRAINGSIANVTGSSEALISMSGAATLIVPPQTSFQLTELPDGPLDLVANREFIGQSGFVPDRVIVRRSQLFTNNATMPALDFGAAEALSPASNTATLTGLAAGESNFLDITFTTAAGTSHALFSRSSFGASPLTIYGIPATLTQSGDYHQLDLEADATNGFTYRGLTHFYRILGPMTLTLGANLSTPQYTEITNTPYVRYRAQLLSQADYNSLVTVLYSQGSGGSARDFSVTATRAYFGGTPTTWTIDMPDLTQAGGFPSSRGIQPGFNTTRIIEASGGSLADIIGAKPTDEATARFGGHFSEAASVEMSLITDGRRQRRSVIAGRRGRALGR